MYEAILKQKGWNNNEIAERTNTYISIFLIKYLSQQNIW